MTTPSSPARGDRTVRVRYAARFDARLDAWGLTTPLRRDAALAVLVALGSGVLVALLAVTPQQVGEPPLSPVQLAAAALVLVAGCALLCVRRVVPATCLVLTVVLQAAALTVAPAGGSVHGPASVVAAYTCGSLLPARRVTALIAACTVGETLAFLARAVTVPPGSGTGLGLSAVLPLTGGQLFAGVLLYGLPAVAGANVATRRRYVELVALRADEAVEAQRIRADAAVGQERARMARELHDVAAHHLSGMVVQAAVVERLIDRDPQAARRTAASVRRQGRETLRDLRMIVGALRDPADDLSDPGTAVDEADPVPGLAELDHLVTTVRDRGVDVELVRDGPEPHLPPIADVTFHRVVQEALANAREHAPGAAVRVTVRHRPGDETAIEIQNDTPPVAPGTDRPREGRRGFGLVGMRERAQLIGATFAAGPDGHGWSVRLRLPSDPEHTEETT